jgi:hypothetical protein
MQARNGFSYSMSGDPQLFSQGFFGRSIAEIALEDGLIGLIGDVGSEGS